MKLHVILSIAFMTLFCFSNAIATELQIAPGTSIQIKAGDQATVRCSGDSSSGNFFCLCRPKTPNESELIRVDFVGGAKFETVLTSSAFCESRLHDHPACQQ